MAAFILAVVAHVLVVIALLNLAPTLSPPPPEDALKTFSVPSEVPAPAAVRNPSVTKTRKPSPASSGASRPSAAAPMPPTPPVEAPFKLLGGADLFQAADIGKIHGESDEGEGAADSGSGKDSGAAYGPGDGPGGERMYNAEWYRKPTDAELGGYVHGNAPPDSWADIACRTRPDYKVDDCRALGESPLGSGLARSMRLAAWQFRIRPPRLGGKPIMGAWVRIHIAFTLSRKE